MYGITVNCVAAGPTQTGWIDEKEVVYYDFIKGEGFTHLEGSETLNVTIRSNTDLQSNWKRL